MPRAVISAVRMHFNKTFTLLIISIVPLFVNNCISRRNSVTYEYAPLVKSVDIGPDSLNAA